MAVIICYLTMNFNHLKSQLGDQNNTKQKKITDNKNSFGPTLQFRWLLLDKIIRTFKSNLNNIKNKNTPSPPKHQTQKNTWFKYIYTISLLPGATTRKLSAKCFMLILSMFFLMYITFFGFILIFQLPNKNLL